MEVVRDKETGSVTIFLSKEEALNVLNETDRTDNPTLRVLNNKLWNS